MEGKSSTENHVKPKKNDSHQIHQKCFRNCFFVFFCESKLDVSPECDMNEVPLMHAVQSPDAINREMNIQDPPCAVHENNLKLFIFYLRELLAPNLQF